MTSGLRQDILSDPIISGRERAMLSMTSDYITDKGNPEEAIRMVAEAGFDAIHWCHHWSDDFIYTEAELEHIQANLKKYKLDVLWVHASEGQEKRWSSPVEYQRRAGVELVRNRIEMACILGTDAIVLHAPYLAHDAEPFWNSVLKSLEELEGFALERKVAIAIENLPNDDFVGIDQLLAKFPPEFIGICYDSGHGNIGRGDGLAQMERRKDRLIAMHLHDNNGFHDQHKNLFKGTIDWGRLAKIIAKSPCRDRLNLESNVRNSGGDAASGIPKEALAGAKKFERMIRKAR